MTATVVHVKTCKKFLPGGPEVDILQLSHDGKSYFVETDEVGIYHTGQEVEVAATGWINETPTSLILVG